MKRLAKASTLSLLISSSILSHAQAEEFKLAPIMVIGEKTHPSQQIRKGVDDSYNNTRSETSVDGGILQNLNPVNKGDALRYNATGLINTPEGGNRFGGGKKIRTFGDWGASESIDGLPAFKTQGGDGGGYSNTLIPSIAVDRIDVLKGGRAVQYGNGTDGGVISTKIKSGRDYDDHQALSLDVSSESEAILQGEAANHNNKWDYYTALSGFHGNYQGEQSNINKQSIGGGLGKFGINLSDDTRAEFMAIYDRSEPDIYRNGAINELTAQTIVGSATLDHKLNEHNSVQAGVLATNSTSKWPERDRDRGLDTYTLFTNHFITYPLNENVDYDGSFGGEYKQTRYVRDESFNNTFDDYAVKTLNSFTFENNLTLTGGGRLTFFNNDISSQGEAQPDNLSTDNALSYQLGAAYSIWEDTRLRASYATGYNRFYEKYGNFGTDALATSGAQDEVVESVTTEIGVNQPFDGGYLDVAVYNTVQDNVPRRNNSAIESVEVEQSGIEVEVLKQLTPKLAVSAGYMHIFDLEATRANGQEVNGNIFWDGQATPLPKNQASLRLDYRALDNLGLWSAAYHSTGYESVAADGSTTERDGFTRVDVGTSWQALDDTTLRFRVENVFDERDFGQTVKGFAINDDGKIGRVFWLGLDYEF